MPTMSPTTSPTPASSAHSSAHLLLDRVGFLPRLDLRDQQIPVYTDQITVLIGENGAGKSTLLNGICGLLPSTHGKIAWVSSGISREFTDWTHLPAHQRARDVASMGQRDPISPVFSNITVKDRLLHSLLPASQTLSSDDKSAFLEQLHRYAEDLGIHSLWNRPLATLSGGELRRVSVVRALAQPSVKLCVLDEPYAGVDVCHQSHLSRTFARYKRGRAVLISVHDLHVAQDIADSVIFLRRGKLFAAGAASQWLTRDALEAVFQAPMQEWWPSDDAASTPSRNTAHTIHTQTAPPVHHPLQTPAATTARILPRALQREGL